MDNRARSTATVAVGPTLWRGRRAGPRQLAGLVTVGVVLAVVATGLGMAGSLPVGYLSSITVDRFSAVGLESPVSVDPDADPFDLGATEVIGDGSDGLWAITSPPSAVTHVDPTTNEVAEHVVPGAFGVRELTLGPDARPWFLAPTGSMAAVGTIDDSGEVVLHEVDPDAFGGYYAELQALTLGPDGALWFTGVIYGDDSVSHLGRITATGEITMFDVSDEIPPMVFGSTIAAGGDGRLWFSDLRSLHAMTTDGQVEVDAAAASYPRQVIADSQGDIWYRGSTSGSDSVIGHVSLGEQPAEASAVEEIDEPEVSQIDHLAEGSNGDIWFTAQVNGNGVIGTLSSEGIVQTFDGPEPLAVATDLASGPQGNLWFPADGVIRRFEVGSTLAGTVSDPDGEPVPFAWAIAVDLEAGRFQGTYANEAGEYLLHLDAGEYLLEFVDPSGDHAGEWYDGHSLRERDLADTFELGPEGAHLHVDLEQAGRTAAVEGTVTAEATGDPVAGAWVVVLPFATDVVAGGAVTAGDGTYRVEDLPAGEYLVAFVDASGVFAFEYSDGVQAVDDATPVELEAGATTTADASLLAGGEPSDDVGAAGSVTGTVIEDGTGDPLEGVWIAAIGSNGLAGGATTDAAGAFVLPLPPGEYRLEVIDRSGAHRAEWYDDAALSEREDWAAVTVPEGGEVVADVGLRPAGPTGSIAGQVLDEGSGEPSHGGWVVAVGPDGGAFAGGAPVDSAGFYEIGGLTAGAYRVFFLHPEGFHQPEWFSDTMDVSSAETVEVSAGAATPLSAALAPAG